MKLFRRRKPETARAWHPGIRLRISVPSGVVVEASSEQLYLNAIYGGRVPCTPECPPDCDEHGWLDLIAGAKEDYGGSEFSTVPLKIEVKPVRLRRGGR